MSTMTRQEIFDKVARHLFQQGRRSAAPIGDNTGCVYRGDGTDKCAVGVLLPDELYRQDMEGDTVVGVMLKYPAVRRELIGMEGDLALTSAEMRGSFMDGPKQHLLRDVERHPTTKLLRDLQTAHDRAENWCTPAGLRDALAWVAAESQLSLAVLDEDVCQTFGSAA